MLTTISLQGASKCLKLLGLRRNEVLWKDLTESFMFPIFQDSTLTAGNASIKNRGGTVSLELLEALLHDPKNDPEPPNNIALPKRKPKKLDAIASKLSARARDLYLLLFFKQASVITTICSFSQEDFGPNAAGLQIRSIARSRIADKLTRYLSPDWYKLRMQSLFTDECCRKHMVDGWYLVSEVMKIRLQELLFEAEKKRFENNDDSETLITVEDVMNAAPAMVQYMVSELAAWIYSFFSGADNPESFLASLFYILNQVAMKLATELSCGQIEELHEDILMEATEAVWKGGPTMPQIRYDATRFLPKMRKHRSFTKTKWDSKSVLLRCRAQDTQALDKYSSFLSGAARNVRNSVSPVAIEENTRTKTDAEYGYQSGDSTDESVPATPPPTEEEHDVLRKHANEHKGKEPPAKRSKLSHHLERLRRNGPAQTAVHKHSTDPHWDKHEFINDGELSEIEERDPKSADDDDNEYEDFEESPELANFATAFNNSIQQFYAEVLCWPVVTPDLRYHDISYRQGNDLLFGNQDWLKEFLQHYGRTILKDVTTAFTLEKYRDHWKSILAMEVRGAVSESVTRRFPNLRKNPSHSWTKDIRPDDFLLVYVEKVSHSKFMTNLSCRCGDPSLTRRIVDEMRGGSLCLGYAETKKGFTELSVVACRRICYDKDDVVHCAQGQSIRSIELKIAVSKERFRDAALDTGSTIRMLHLMHFSTFLRTFKALGESFLLPKPLKSRFYGKWTEVDLPFANKEAMETTVDPKSLEYLKQVRASSTELDESQYEAAVRVFSNIGSCSRGSSSLSLIQGPPGTGKTQTIRNIVGGALHHSTAGHIGRTEVNHMKNILPDDEIIRGSTNLEGLRILITCPSNEAVDNVLRRFKEDGIPDGKGKCFHRQCVRVAREDYNYKDLDEFSINSKALPIDIHWLNRDDPNRKRASSAARKAFGKECVVVLTTLATSGGMRLKELKMEFDIVIIDEAGQTFEPETLMPIVTCCKRSRLQRCHVIQIGDHVQLRRMSNAFHMVKSVDYSLHFNYSKQIISQFERLFTKSRCTISMLTKQYRMHPDISSIHSEAFYNSLVESPLSAEKFSAMYNQGWKGEEEGFAPFTIIDTSKLDDKMEYNNGPGKYANLVEIHIVSEILNELKKCFGTPAALREQVSVIAPYRYAIDKMDRILRAPSFALHDSRYREIRVQTVDSMQGRERDIIIFSATRSNPSGEIGFLENSNRLNVAFSRARKLLVIVGDMSTLCKADTEIFKIFFDNCRKGSPGCQLIARINTKHGSMSGYAKLGTVESS